MGPEQMEAGSDNGGLEQIGTWGNEYLGQMGICGNGYLGKIYIWGNWAPGEMGAGANRHLGKWTFGEKGYPKCSNGVPQVPGVHFPQMFTNGHWGKWALGANGHLGKRSTPSALCPFSPNACKWALG